MPPPSRIHGLLSSKLLRLLGNFAESHGLGNVTGSDAGFDLGISPKTGRATVRIPDVAFVAKARESKGDILFKGAPDLAVEVISPSETYTMVRQKLTDYFAAGTRLMWLVYPDAEQIEVFTALESVTELGLEDTLTGGDLLPEFSVKVKDIFAVIA